MPTKTLESVVAKRPYPEYQDWWEMGGTFIRLMGDAIHKSWEMLAPTPNALDRVQKNAAEYLRVVFQRDALPTLTRDFITPMSGRHFYSGEFDALSYAFFRDAFETISQTMHRSKQGLARRAFTQQVGERFYSALHALLALDSPSALRAPQDLAQLKTNLETLGTFLVSEGYLRDSFSFTFDVDVTHQGQTITQSENTFLEKITRGETGYALYKMGYPAILPSAVYLYHTIGEAQHHSSRTMEALFARMGCTARETDDFDPIGYPADKVVELWEIHA